MGSLTDYAENEILDFLLTAESVTRPTAWYVGLFTAAPSDSGGGTEVSGNAYARTAVTFGAASGLVKSSDAAVNFPQATGSWGTITHWGIFDAVTGGNLLAWGALSASITIGNLDEFRIASGDIDLTASGAFTTYGGNLVLDWMFDDTAVTRPTNWFIAWHTGDPGTAGSSNEANPSGYARGDIDFDAAASGATQNAAEVLVGPTSASWGTISHWSINTASTVGNFLLKGAFNASNSVGSGDYLRIQDGSFDLTLD